MPTDPRLVKEVFAAALDRKDPAERAAYLAEACRGDDELRRRVEALLRASEHPDSFLDDPPPLTPAMDTPGPESPVTGVSPPEGEAVGTVVAGRYRLLKKFGEGGMGVVFLAEQTEPVRRAVAVKVIRAGMDSRTVLARFEAERQALALMDHPNIAKVLDAGATAEGRPYFVMELVRGVPITKFCD